MRQPEAPELGGSATLWSGSSAAFRRGSSSAAIGGSSLTTLSRGLLGVVMVMHRLVLGSLSRRLGGYCLCAISSRLRIAGCLIDTAGSSLRLLGSSLRLACGRLSARRRLIRPLRRILRALRGVGLA